MHIVIHTKPETHTISLSTPLPAHTHIHTNSRGLKIQCCTKPVEYIIIITGVGAGEQVMSSYASERMMKG